jgi:hypothetical protein
MGAKIEKRLATLIPTHSDQILQISTAFSLQFTVNNVILSQIQVIDPSRLRQLQFFPFIGQSTYRPVNFLLRFHRATAAAATSEEPMLTD